MQVFFSRYPDVQKEGEMSSIELYWVSTEFDESYLCLLRTTDLLACSQGVFEAYYFVRKNCILEALWCLTRMAS